MGIHRIPAQHANKHHFAPGTVVGYRYTSPARRRINRIARRVAFGLVLLVAIPAALGAVAGLLQALCAIGRGLL